MSVRNQWSQGLQWGGCVWLVYVAWVACRDAWLTSLEGVVELWPHSWCYAASWLLAPAWLAVIVLIAAGSRWARVGVAALVVVRAGLFLPQGVGELGAWYGDGPVPYAVAHVHVLIPLLPLAVLRVEGPRVVVALAALGRWREAFARFGGAGTALVAATLLATEDNAREVMMRGADARSWMIPAAVAAVAGVVTWRAARRGGRAATGC